MRKLLILSLLLIHHTHLFSQVALYVDSSNTAVLKNGSSWAAAYDNIIQAVSNSSAGDTIYIAKGTYQEGSTLHLPHDLIIKGGYPSGGGALPSTSHPTVIDGNNSHRVIAANTPGLRLYLSHLVLQNGSVSSAGNQFASGITTGANATLKMVHCKVRNNNAASSNSTVLGGGIFTSVNTHVILINCEISTNTISSNGGVTGAGIYFSGGTFQIINSLISKNISNGSMSVSGTAGIEAAGISDTCRIINSLICDNLTHSGGASAGALRFPGGTHHLLLIDNSIISGNKVNNNLVLPINASSLPIIRYSYLQGAPFTTNGNINATLHTPHFVDPMSGNYKLLPGSPLVNAGNNAALPSDSLDLDRDSDITEPIPYDLDGGMRIYDNVVDIGAYELQQLPVIYPTVLYVDSSNTNTTQDGLSWSTAFHTLSEAFHVLNHNSLYSMIDSVLIAKGTYYPTGSQTSSTPTQTQRDTSFAILRGGLKLYGGFPNGGGTFLQRTMPSSGGGSGGTILSGEIDNNTNHFNNSNHILVIAGISAGADSIVLDGLCFTAAYAASSGDKLFNGISVAGTNGGAVAHYNDSIAGKTLFRYCHFIDNRARSSTSSGGNGGAIYNYYSSPTITDCVFSGNISTFHDGGGISNNYSSPYILNCVFTGNIAGYRGGAVYNNSSSPIVKNCVFTGNNASAGGSTGGGGGICNLSSSPLITSCIFSENSTGYRGGGMSNVSSQPAVVNCIFYGNMAAGNGTFGGGMYNSSSAPMITNCTFSSNTASGTGSDGGAMYNVSGSYPSISNTVIYGNSSGISAHPFSNPVSPVITYSLIQGLTASTDGNINGNIDPLFLNASDPAGLDGIWGTPDDGLALQPCSPVINAGSNDSSSAAGIITDITSSLRIAAAIVDMGAYEYQGTVAVPAASIQTAAICQGQSYIFNDIAYTTSNYTATDTFYTVNGCDSIVTLNLTVYVPDTTYLTQTSCNSYTWPSNNMTYAVSGTYYDTLPSSNNCDSLLVLDLTIHNEASIVVQPLSSVTGCEGTNLLIAAQADHVSGFQWYKNNLLISDNGNVSGSQTDQLLLSNVSSLDNGSYTLVAVSSSSICGNDTSAISQVAVNNLNITLAGNAASSSIIQQDGMTAMHSDIACNPIAAIADVPDGDDLGSVSIQVNVDGNVQTINGQPYLQRHYVIASTNNAAATVVLYAAQSEFDAYNLEAGAYPLLPTNGADPNRAHLQVSQYTGSPFITSPNLITPASVAWNNSKLRWEITFDVAGFSSFYIHTGTYPLDIDLAEFTVTNYGHKNRIEWLTATERNEDRFVLEKSTNGEAFLPVCQLKAHGNPAAYVYWDEELSPGKIYYRLKIIDKNTSYAYSKTVSVIVGHEKDFSMSVYPNPFTDAEIITVTMSGELSGQGALIVMDCTGNVVFRKTGISEPHIPIDLKMVASGLYVIRYTDLTNTAVLKVSKQ